MNRQINAGVPSHDIFNHFSMGSGDNSGVPSSNQDLRMHNKSQLVHDVTAAASHNDESKKAHTNGVQDSKLISSVPLVNIANLPAKQVDDSHPLIQPQQPTLKHATGTSDSLGIINDTPTKRPSGQEDNQIGSSPVEDASSSKPNNIAQAQQSSFTKNMKNAHSSFKRSLRSNTDSLKQLPTKPTSLSFQQTSPINSAGSVGNGLLARTADIALETSIGQSSTPTEDPTTKIIPETPSISQQQQQQYSISNSGQAGYRFNQKTSEGTPNSETANTPTVNESNRTKLVQVNGEAVAATTTLSSLNDKTNDSSNGGQNNQKDLKQVLAQNNSNSKPGKTGNKDNSTQSSAEVVANAVFAPIEPSKIEQENENQFTGSLRNRSSMKMAKQASLTSVSTTTDQKKKLKTPLRKARVSRSSGDRASSMNTKRHRFSDSNSQLDEDDDENHQEEEDEEEEMSDKKRGGGRKQSLSQGDERSGSEHGQYESGSQQNKQETKKRGKLKKRGIRDLTTEEKWQVYEDYDRIQSYRGVGRMFNMDHSTVKLLILRINQEYPGEKITKDMFLRGQIAQPAPEMKITKKQKLEQIKQAKNEEKMALEMQMRSNQMQENIYLPANNSPMHDDDQIMLDNMDEPTRQGGNAAGGYEQEYQIPLSRQSQKKKSSKSKKDTDGSQAQNEGNFSSKMEDPEAQNDGYAGYASRYEEQQFENGGSIKLDGAEFYSMNQNAYGDNNLNGNMGGDQIAGDVKEKRKYISKSMKQVSKDGTAVLTKTISEEKTAKKKAKKKTLYESMQFNDDGEYNGSALDHQKMAEEGSVGTVGGGVAGASGQSTRSGQNGNNNGEGGANMFEMDNNLFEGQLNLLQQTEGQFLQQYQGDNYAENVGGYAQAEPNYEIDFDDLQTNLHNGGNHHQPQSQQQQYADIQNNDDDLKLEMS